MISKIKQEIDKLKNKKQAEILQKFFKTKPGQYGEGDIFLGLKVGDQRKIAKKYLDLGFKNLQILLNSKIHEYRLVALLILVEKLESIDNIKAETQSTSPLKKQIYKFYLKNTKNINNWDLVDLTAPKIMGQYLLNQKQKNKQGEILVKLAHSKNLWERRIAIVTTLAFIKQDYFKPTIQISEMLLKDKHDLIHKASGWMLREVGKRNQNELIKFLDKFNSNMPRAMLRYAIEKFNPQQRKYYLKLKQ